MNSIDDVMQALQTQNYIAERGLATAIFLALKLKKPLFLEGEAGVGKTEVAKVLSTVLNAELIRMQCYEGLDINTAVYEWNYTRQMLHIRLMEAKGTVSNDALRDIFSPEFMIKRPLLRAIEDSREAPPILLIDELDRADEEFEAFLLELLSDWQVTVPEVGTIRAVHPPIVVLTSNRTREIHDALKRRCIYFWIDYPSLDKELRIVRSKVPEASDTLARQIVSFVQQLRQMELYKVPGVAETIDWAAALTALNQTDLESHAVDDTLGVILKYQDDVHKVQGAVVRELVARAQS
jgi:MoxR-like ATPase